MIRVLPEDGKVSAETCRRFSKQYKYSVVGVQLFGKLKVQLVYIGPCTGAGEPDELSTCEEHSRYGKGNIHSLIKIHLISASGP